MEWSFGSVTLSAIAVCVSILMLKTWMRRCTIPGPRGWPFIGILPKLRHELFMDFREFAKDYGDVFQVNMGTSNAIVVSKMEIADEMFRKNPEIFNDRFVNIPENIDIPIGFGELQYCEKWKEMRGFTINTLNNQDLGDRTFEDLLNEEVNYFINYVIKRYEDKPFHPKEPLMHCMGNILISLVFRKRFKYGNTEMLRYISAAHDLPQCLDPVIFFGVPSLIQILARFNFVPIPKLRRSQLALDKIADECHAEIAQHKEKMDFDNPRDFIDVYLREAEKRKETKTFLTENTLKGVTSNLFAAGLDSTASMLIWLVLLMTKYPHVQEKVRKEVDLVIGAKRLPTLKDRELMPYTKATLQESHRFVSIAPMGMFHIVAKDTTYNGHFVPKGMAIIANYWAMHHDDRLFPEPFDYKPERFMSDKGEFLRSRHVTPYGVGKRACPGEVLAQRELFLFLTQLLQRFHLKPPPGVDTKDIPEDGVYDGVGFFAPEFQTTFHPRPVDL